MLLHNFVQNKNTWGGYILIWPLTSETISQISIKSGYSDEQ